MAFNSKWVVTKETDKFVEYTAGTYSRKENKFPTIGGPFDGQVLCRTQVGKEYIQFNRSDADDWYNPTPKQINILYSLLVQS